MYVAMPPYDRARASKELADADRSFQQALDRVADDPQQLYWVARDAVRAAALQAALDPSSRRLPDLVRIAARAGTALLTLARVDGEAVDVQLDGDAAVRLAGSPDASLVNVGLWLDSAWLATLGDDAASVALLALVQDDLLRASPARGDDFLYLLAGALRAYWTGGDAGRPLLATLEATDPERVTQGSVDRVLDLHVPVIDAFFRLLERDDPGFDEALAKGLELHVRYWERAGIDAEALVPVRFAALARRARLTGMQVTIESDGLPAALVDAPPPDELLLCPYCLTPIAEDAQICPGCRRDPTKDAPLEEDVEALRTAPRRPCPHCGNGVLPLAVVCPRCGNHL